MHNMFSKITSKKSRLIALAIVIITAIYSSCSNKEEQFIEPEEVKKLPVVKVDSIFIDLNSDIIQNKKGENLCGLSPLPFCVIA